MKLTQDNLRDAYTYLHGLPPFNGWGLPDAEDIKFEVIKDRTTMGDCMPWTDGTFRLRLSQATVRKPFHILETMAHEMVHVAQVSMLKMRMCHGPIFDELAAKVCRFHGFKLEGF